jgi:hypothetical protein
MPVPRIQLSPPFRTQHLQILGRKRRFVNIDKKKLEFYVNIYQGTGAAKKGSSNAAASSGAGSDIVSELEAELSSLGIDLGSLGLRDLPILETRKGKKKNGTAVAAGAAVSRLYPIPSLVFR